MGKPDNKRIASTVYYSLLTEMTDTQKLIQAVEQAYSPTMLIKSVRELAATRSEEAIPTLIQVLGYNNPGAAIAAVEGLVTMGDVAVPALLSQIDGYDYGARAWSHRALSQIGNPSALNSLLEAASSDFALSVRRAAAKGLGHLHWEKLPTEEIPSAQEKVLDTLMQIAANDDEWVVRYAAIVGLQSLAGAIQQTFPEGYTKIVTQLETVVKEDAELAVQARAQLALKQLNSVNSHQLPITNNQ